MPRCAAIMTGPNTHLDHLGVLSAYLKIPFIVTDEKAYALAKTFYPDLNVSLVEPSELTLDFLAHHFDLLLESGKFWAADLIPIMKLLYGKTMRFAFCPHGNSDKGHSLRVHVQQDISLFYGQHMRDLLRANGADQQISHLIRTGNYRLPYYLAHKSFYDTLARDRVFSHFDVQKKTLLYAPTWQDGENPSSFFTSCEKLITQLSGSFNLLIKLHPFLEEYHPATVIHLIAKYENTPGILFLEDFPAIYPLLAHIDLYLGDFSSISYDFLYFDRPLFFFKRGPLGLYPKTLKNRHLGLRESSRGSSPGEGVVLEEIQPPSPGDELRGFDASPNADASGFLGIHHCGMEIPCEYNILQYLEEQYEANRDRFSESRKETYAYAFGEERTPEAIWEEILAKSTLLARIGANH